MPNVSFDIFKKDFPEFDESLRGAYFQSVVCSDPPIEQRGFMVESLQEAMALIRVRDPVKVICGTLKLLDSYSKKLPVRLQWLVEGNGWYEGSVFIVMDAGPLVNGVRTDKAAPASP